MKIIKNILAILVLVFTMRCASHKAKKQESQLSIPELGTIVKVKKRLLHNTTEAIGLPNWQQIEVDIQELPFNLNSYLIYTKHMQRAGKINTIAYNDSLRFKPKYIRLKLSNKVKLTSLLNNEDHRETREYISLNKDYKLVTAIDVAFTENEISKIQSANGVHLSKDKLGNLIFALNTLSGKEAYLLKNVPVFKYALSSFCWGEDRYHNLRIENIVTQGDGCPKNTYQKASKIKSNKEYLKF